MVVTRSGKKTTLETVKILNKKNEKQKFKLRELTIRLKKLSPDELKSLMFPAKRYNLRVNSSKNEQRKTVVEPSKSKRIAVISRSNFVWNLITSRTNESYQLYPSEIVLAKMNNFRPWPARVNSVYKVGSVTKCVFFYGTFQIGSVLKSQCVKISDSEEYLSHAVHEIKQKYKWEMNYDFLADTNDDQRVIAIAKLTQVQKFFLAIRDIEREKKVPYDLSMVKSSTE